MRNPDFIPRLQMIFLHKITGCICMPRLDLGNLLILFIKEFKPAVLDGLVNNRILCLQFFSVHIFQIGFFSEYNRLNAIIPDGFHLMQDLIDGRFAVRTHRDDHIIADPRLIQIGIRSVHDGNNIANSARYEHRCQQNKTKQYCVHYFFSFQIFFQNTKKHFNVPPLV